MNKTLGKYKDNHPLGTISRIREILSSMGLVLMEQWLNEVEGYYSLNLSVPYTPLYSNGKGTSPEFALASAYGEFMERLQNAFMKGLKMYLCPSMLDYGGFSFAPDEMSLSIDELIDSGGSWLDLLMFGANTREEKRRVLDKWLIETSLGKPSDFKAIPFLKISDGSLCYMPDYMVFMCYGSNGMCAGNTKEEALVQGISEIMERYVTIKLLKEKLTPPTVPDEYIRRFPYICDMLEQIKKKGNYRIIVKDCSLGEGYPVAAIIFIDMDTNSYFVKLGAHPAFEIAIERCLTELLQGRELSNKAWLTKFSYFNEKYDSLKNILSTFVTGTGSYPIELFGRSFSYEFSEPEDCSSLSNKEMLSLLIQKLRTQGREIYVRDVSYLGFPSFNVIIPGMSEGFTTINSIDDLNNKYCGADKIGKRLNESSNEEIEMYINFIYEYYTAENTLVSIIDAPLNNAFPLYGIKRDLLLSTLFYRIEKFKQAYDVLDDYINEISKSGTNPEISYYKCVRDYMGARSENMGDSSIKELLSTFYPAKLVDRVISGMSDPSGVLKNYPRLNCYDCQECKYTRYCYFNPIKDVYKELKERYGKSPIDQRSNLFLTDIYNKK